jgi:hypothetical protein
MGVFTTYCQAGKKPGTDLKPSNGVPNLYPLVIQHSHGKWPIEIDGLPIKNGDFPWLS